VRTTVPAWLVLAALGCVGGVRLEGDGEDALPDSTAPEVLDVPVLPPPESPAWCPETAASAPCRLVERTRVRLEGRIAALGFVDDGAYALVAWSPASGSDRGSRVELLHVTLAGDSERTAVELRSTGLAAVWLGDGFAAFVGESSTEDAMWARVGLDGTATTGSTGARICEALVPTAAGYRCVTASTRDVQWLTLDDEGVARDARSHTVDGFLRTAAWGAAGPGVLYTSGRDEPTGLSFLYLDAAGTVVGGPHLVSPDSVDDMLLAPSPRGFLGLAVLWVRAGEETPSPTGRRWGLYRLVLMHFEPDGSLVWRPVEVAHFRTNGHVASWGPTHFAVAAGSDDAVVAWRHVEVRPDDPIAPERSLLRFRAVTPEGAAGDTVELEPTTDDDFITERIDVLRAGTGVAVARSRSRSGERPLGLDLWLGCCE
jgi:hypothetical protein